MGGLIFKLFGYCIQIVGNCSKLWFPATVSWSLQNVVLKITKLLRLLMQAFWNLESGIWLSLTLSACARVTVLICLSVCVCVCVSLTTLEATLIYSAKNGNQ